MKIAATIILYNPILSRLNESITELIKKVNIIYLIDNCSKNILEIEENYKSNKKIRIIKNQKNMGIATALNQALDISYKDEIDFLITLDQDSIFKEKMINNLLKYKDEKDVALLCPIINDINKEKKYELDNEYIDVNRCITSGTVMNLQECKKIGYFDEKMFIDYVDFDYCKRVKLAGKRIIRINNSVIEHEIGKRSPRKFLFWKVYPTNHSSTRIYYYARNIKYYLYKFKKDLSLKEKINEYIYLIWKFVSILLYEENKKEKLKMYNKGIREYKINQTIKGSDNYE